MIKDYKEYYDRALSKRDAKQVVQSMEIKARNNREFEQAKRFEQVQYEKNIGKFVCKLQDKWS